MADEKKTNQKKDLAAENASVIPTGTEESAAGAKETPAATPAKTSSRRSTTASKKTAGKKATAKTQAKTAEKASAKTAAKASAKSADKTPAKTTRRTPKKKEINLDTITTALWNKLEKADVSGIEGVVAVQVNIDNMGTFYICVRNGEKEIMQYEYYNRDGDVCCSADEALKIAGGNYNFLAAVESGALKYHGNLERAMLIMNLFK